MYSITDDIGESLTSKYILSLITEEDIFKLVFKEIPISFVTSPFREDKNPGCFFQRDLQGRLRFVDFGDSRVIKGKKMNFLDCFDAVQIYYDLFDFYRTLEFIYDKCIKGKELIENRREELKTSIIRDKKRILIQPRNFIQQDEIFWTRFQISKKNLTEDMVIPVSKVRILSSRKETSNIDCYFITYAYTEFEKEHKKIYFPYGSTRFISTCTQNDIGSVKHILYEKDYLLITKSYKDCRILRNLSVNSVWFQNEGMIPEDKILISLINPFIKIFIFFDNDKAGINASNNLKQKILSLFEIEVIQIFLPSSDGIKDSGEAVEKLGVDYLTKFLINSDVIRY